MKKWLAYQFEKMYPCRCGRPACPVRHYWVVQFSIGPELCVDWWLSRN